MGFYISINCTLDICNDTGRHFYYDGFQQVYTMPPIVPKEYRGFVKMSGDIFRIYTRLITDETSTSVENFADKYPEWSDILESCDFDENSSSWNEVMHDMFYDALKWFSEKKISYIISWYE